MAMIPRPHLKIPNDYDTVKSAVSSIAEYVKNLEERIASLEQAYMEEKLLGKSEDPGTIEECKTTINK
jgi:hypothetical protein